MEKIPISNVCLGGYTITSKTKINIFWKKNRHSRSPSGTHHSIFFSKKCDFCPALPCQNGIFFSILAHCVMHNLYVVGYYYTKFHIFCYCKCKTSILHSQHQILTQKIKVKKIHVLMIQIFVSSLVLSPTNLGHVFKCCLQFENVSPLNLFMLFIW